MANEKLNKIVVNGGSRRVGRLLSTLSYGLILFSTWLLIYLGERRGINESLNLVYYIALGINSVQVLYSLVTWFIEGRGVFLKKRKTFEMIINFVWIAAVIAEFVVGSITSIAGLRMDLLLIALVQLVIIAFVFRSSNAIENSVNVKYGSGDFSKRERKKVFRYTLIFLFLAVLQVAVMFIPKLPPRIDDIFSENRALEYVYDTVYTEDGEKIEGYFVQDIYYGLNETVIVPSTYNNKPVVGIKAKALYDSGTISTLVLGEYVDGKLHSNLKIIESEAINLNSIISLELPDSLIRLDENAISSSSLINVTFASDCKLKLDAFNTPSVNEIVITSEEVVSVDFGSKDYELIVSEELYNSYRENNYEQRQYFALEELDNKIIIDFETNCGVYLESKILTLEGGVAYLDLESLKNNHQSASTSFIVDTQNYNENHATKLESETNAGYVFRGWYRDSEYKVECEFSNDTRTRFSEDTTVYAKWEKIYNVKLDWGTDWRPNGAPTFLNYIKSTDEKENVLFPALDIHGGDVTRVGYSNLQWEYNGNCYTDIKGLVQENPDLEDNAVIKVKWELEKPVIDFIVRDNDGERKDNTPVYIFDGNNKTYEAEMTHKATDVTLTYIWSKDGVVIKRSQTDGFFTEVFRNCNQSGVYELVCIADNGHNVTSQISTKFTITIEKKDLENIFEAPENTVGVYNGLAHNVIYNLTSEQKLYYSSNIMYDLDGDGVYESNVGPVNHKNGYYGARIVISRNDGDRDNYNTREIDTYIFVEQKEVTANWTQTGTSFNGFETVYSSKKQELVPSIVGLIESDVDKGIKFITSTAGNDANQTNIGTYITSISGIDFGSNPENYKLGSTIVNQMSWNIIPKTLTSTWKNLEHDYNGETQYVELVIYNLEVSDGVNYQSSLLNQVFGNIGATSYIYNSNTKEATIKFAVKNAGDYDFEVSSIFDENYTLASTSTTATVNKAILSLIWSNLNHVYNANTQNATLTVSGFKVNDASTINLNNFGFISEDTTSHNITNEANSVTLTFSAINQQSYQVGLSEIEDLNNYELSSQNRTNTFKISPLKLVGSWTGTVKTYNSDIQSAKYTITNIPLNELGTFNLDDFVATIDGVEDASEVVCYVDGNNLVLEFKKENADTYALNIDNSFGLSRSGNYTFESTNTTLTINPLTLTIDWVNSVGAEELVYSSTNYTVSPVGTNVYDDDVVNFTVTGNTEMNAGTYVATITGIDNTNYKLNQTTKNYSWSISKKLLDVNFDFESDAIYNGKYRTAIVKVSGITESDYLLEEDQIKALFSLTNNGLPYEYSALLNTDSYELRFSAIDAGSYSVTLNSFNDSNYDYSNITNTFQFAISPRVITVDWDYTNAFTYSGVSQEVNAIVNNLVVRDDTSVKDTIDLTITNRVKVNAGDYHAEITEATNSNYILSGDIDYSLDWSINKKQLTYSWTTPNNYEYNASEQEVTLVIDGFVNGEENALSFSDFNYSTNLNNYSTSNYLSSSAGKVTLHAYYKNVGEYDITYNYYNSNYQIDTPSSYLNITPVTLDLVWTDNSFTYCASNQQEVVSATNICGSDVLCYFYEYYKVTGSGEELINSAIDAGSYKVKCTGVDSDNYVLPNDNSVEKEFTIARKALTLTWPEYQSEFTYNAASQGFYYMLDGYVTSNDANYAEVDLTYDNLTLNSRVVESTVNGYSLKQFIRTVNVNSYQVTVSQSVEDKNYYIVEETKSFEIVPLMLDLTWRDTVTTYNNDYQRAYVDAFNICTGDVINFTYSSRGVSHSGVAIDQNSNYAKYAGVYEITVTGIDNPNYVLPTLETEITSEFIINKKHVSINYNDVYKTYNGEIQTYTASLLGVFEEDYNEIKLNHEADATDPLKYLVINHNINNVTNVYSYENGMIYINALKAGTYNITSDDHEFYNYILNESSVTLTMDQRTLDISWPSVDYTYNGSYQTITPVATNICGSDVVSFIMSGNSAIDAGSNIASIDGLSGSDSSNYKLFSNTTRAWTISQLMVDLNWNYTDPFTYDGTSKQISATINNLCVREDTGIIDEANLTFSACAKTEAGTYSGRVTAVDNTNYTVANSLQCSWTINPVELEYTWTNNVDTIYDGTQKSISIIVSGFVGDDISSISSYSFQKTMEGIGDLSYSTNGNDYVITISGVNAGHYGFRIDHDLLDNYTLNETTTGTIDIAQKELSVSYSYLNEFTYDNTIRSIYATINGFVSGEAANYNLNSFNYSASPFDQRSVYSTTDTSLVLEFGAKNAGTYSVNILSISTNNYKLADASEKKLIIEKAALGYINPSNTSYTYDGINHEITLTITGVYSESDANTIINNIVDLSKDYVSYLYSDNTIEISINATNVGAYSVGINAAELTNYETQGFTLGLWINKKDVSVSWSTASQFTYDGLYHGVVATLNGIVDSDKDDLTTSSFSYYSELENVQNDHMSVEYNPSNGTISFMGVGAGKYEIQNIRLKYTEALSNNYNVYNCYKEFEIAKKNLTADWFSYPIYVYDGTEQGYTAVIEGIIPGDEGTISLSNFTWEGNVNASYSQADSTIYMNAIDAGQYYANNIKFAHSNYTLDDANIGFEIIKHYLEGTWSAGSKYTYNGETQYVTLTLSGFEEGTLDKLVASNFTFKEGVTPEVRAYSDGSGYSVEFRFPIKNTSTYTVGIEAINETVFAGYDFNRMVKTVIVAPKELTVTWQPETETVFDTEEHNVHVTISGFCGTDGQLFDASYYYFTGDVTTDDAVFTNNATSAEFTFSQSSVGVYNYNLSATELGNYYFLSSSFQYEIKPYTNFEITWTYPETTTYTGYKNITLTFSGLESGYLSLFRSTNFDSKKYQKFAIQYTQDSINGTYITFILTCKDVGTYYAEIEFFDGIEYTGSKSTSAMFTVTRVEVVGRIENVVTDTNNLGIIFTGGGNYPVSLSRGTDYIVEFFSDPSCTMPTTVTTSGTYYALITLSNDIIDNVVFTGGLKTQMIQFKYEA